MHQIVQGFQVGQLAFHPIDRLDHLAAKPLAGLRESADFVPHDHHQILPLLDQTPRRGHYLGHIVLEPFDHRTDPLDLTGQSKHRDPQGDRHANNGQRDHPERNRHCRADPCGRGRDLYERERHHVLATSLRAPSQQSDEIDHSPLKQRGRRHIATPLLRLTRIQDMGSFGHASSFSGPRWASTSRNRASRRQ